MVIATYTGIMVQREGIPYSISATYYSLKHRLWFGATMWLTAGLLMPTIIESTSSNYQFTAFLACFGLMLIGAAPNFKESLDKKVHISGAVLCILFSQLWVAFTCMWSLLIWIGYLIFTVFCMKKHWVGNLWFTFLSTRPMFWIEIFSLLTVYLTLLIA